MAIISTANLLSIADNIARTLLDMETCFITNPSVVSPTTATIAAGQNGVSSSLESRVASLNDINQEADLAPLAIDAATEILGYIAGIGNDDFYVLYSQFMIALERHTGGLSSYIATNNLQVHPEFANAFNLAAISLLNESFTKILAANTFIPSVLTLGSIAVTGASTGTFSAGSAINQSLYAPAPLFLKNTALSPTTGTATSFTISYTDASGSASSTTKALSGALGAGASLAIGVTGFAVSNISVASNGSNGDTLAVIVNPARSVTY